MSHRPPRLTTPALILAGMAGLLVVRLIAVVVRQYDVYFPPDFDRAEFLFGREAQFAGPYRWAFAVHVVSGPIALGLGLILAFTGVTGRRLGWHRGLGWMQAGCVLGLVAPSGLGMAWYAAAGPVAAVGLAALAVSTAACVALGTRAASRGQTPDHRRWMGRTLALLSSAVVLRVLGGLGSVLGVSAPWYDPLMVWVSWLAPLAGSETYRLNTRRARSTRRPRS